MTDTSPTTPTPPASPATLAPRQPTDRQPSKADQIADETMGLPEGWDVLKPVIELRSAAIANAQADLLDLFEEIGVDLNAGSEVDQEIETSAATIRALGRMAEVLEKHTVDIPAFVKLDTGPGAQGRIMSLAMWYLTKLGESEGSAT
jgi:hypothetical protein